MSGPDPAYPPIAIFAPVSFAALFSIHSEVEQDLKFSTLIHYPGGRLTASDEESLHLLSGSRGIFLSVRMEIETEEEGVLWLELLISGQTANKVPIRVRHPVLNGHTVMSLAEWTRLLGQER